MIQLCQVGRFLMSTEKGNGMVTLEKVNEWAKKSCPKWNKNRLSRRANRKAYRDSIIEWLNSPEGRKCIRLNNTFHNVDTYPWPYRDPYFANWEEDDSNENYSLVSDQSGCVIKHSTSYCAWKIYEVTGIWPQKTSKERLDAKRWRQFLAEAGYTNVVDFPKGAMGHNIHHYVGIDPNEGEYGLVVWFEYNDYDSMTVVSTYLGKQYTIKKIDPTAGNFTWVEID